ncbi:hypothetical protein NQ315_003491 [Exocentrus adspersus]|uniref:Reverse transcriptase n=1 Tax=Exocentrus adspersus TaxID=1586481 RepID=A0AAV8V920_9CUCU|nr:hypothetical protein NQ315_003491 [Exocentrus adspersus]
MDCIDDWMHKNGLELAPGKTEAVLRLQLRANKIPVGRSLKYLGVYLDWQGTFGEHVKYVCQKAQSSVSSLYRIMPNVGGPRDEKRHLLARVLNPHHPPLRCTHRCEQECSGLVNTKTGHRLHKGKRSLRLVYTVQATRMLKGQ